MGGVRVELEGERVALDVERAVLMAFRSVSKESMVSLKSALASCYYQPVSRYLG